IRFLRLVGQAPFVGPDDACAGAVGERQQTAAQRVAVERFHAVEEREEKYRRNLGEDDDQQREHKAARQPPRPRRNPDLPIDEARAAAGEPEADRESLRLIEQPEAEALVREPVAVLEEVTAVERNGQAPDLVDDRQKEDVGEDAGGGSPLARDEAGG